MSLPTQSASTNALWPLPPVRLTLRGLVGLVALIVISIIIAAWYQVHVAAPLYQGATGINLPGRASSPIDIESVVIAPIWEETAFRLAFSTTLPILIATSRTSTVAGGLACFILLFASFAGFGLLGFNILGLCYLISLISTLPIIFYAVKGRSVPRKIWITAAIVSTVMFALAHLNNYALSSYSPASLLLIFPQLLGGMVFCYATIRHGLRVSILAHMISNGLLIVPPFVAFLDLVR